MPQDMPMPQGQAAQAPAPQEKAGAQSATKLVSEIHSGMLELMDIMGQSQVDPQDKQALGSLISGFQSFVEGLSQPPGAQKPQAPQPKGGVVPPEAGAANVRPAL